MTAPLPLPGSLDDLIVPGLWAWERHTHDSEPRGGVVIAVHRTDTGTIIETVKAGGHDWTHHRLHIDTIDPALVYPAAKARHELVLVERRILDRLPRHRPGTETRHRLHTLLCTIQQAKENAT